MSTYVDTLIATTQDCIDDAGRHSCHGLFHHRAYAPLYFLVRFRFERIEDASISFGVVCDLKMREEREMV
jgi:hypothetical protein